MTHFDIVQWTDFVRGVADPATSRAMTSHLALGCTSCGALVGRLRAVVELASVEPALEPPAHLVRFARAAFSVNRPVSPFSWPTLAARLVFNSVGAPLVAGARGPADEMSRQTLFEAGDFSVHLKFEQALGASQVSLVGQVANRRAPEPAMSYLPVLVTRGRRVLARSVSNEFGEFQMEYEPRNGLELHIPLQELGRNIRLSLSDPLGND